MGNFIDSAAAVLSQAERSVEVTAQNVANIGTPGYKRQVDFSKLTSDGLQSAASTTDFADGKGMQTNNPYDLSLSGGGFFAVQQGGQLLFTRRGEFHRDADGRLLTAQGGVLQADGGGDLVLKGGEVKVLEDGTVLEDGLPTTKVAVWEFQDKAALTRPAPGMFAAGTAAPVQVDNPVVHQGQLEGSNVSTGDEMVSMMSALRRAESAQKLVNVYDDLMGRAVSVFGQA